VVRSFQALLAFHHSLAPNAMARQCVSRNSKPHLCLHAQLHPRTRDGSHSEFKRHWEMGHQLQRQMTPQRESSRDPRVDTLQHSCPDPRRLGHLCAMGSHSEACSSIVDGVLVQGNRVQATWVFRVP
jgi:hypothetical protein